MKIKSGGAMFATLDLAVHMYAEQRAFQQIMIQSMVKPEDYEEAVKMLNEASQRELELVRATLLQYSEISIENLLNGEFDI